MTNPKYYKKTKAKTPRDVILVYKVMNNLNKPKEILPPMFNVYNQTRD